MIVGKVYRNCDTLPLSRFIDVLVKGDLKRLIKFGFANKNSLKTIWDNIFIEYTDLTKNSTHQHLLTTVKEYTMLSNRIEIVQMLINSLAKRRHLGIINALKKFGFHQSFSPNSMEKDIKSVIAKVKSWVFRANKLYEELKSTEKDEKELKKSDFSDLLIELGSYQGYRIDPDITTVSEYVAILNRFKKHIEDGKRRKNNRAN